MRPVRALEASLLAIGCASPAWAQTQGVMHPGVTIASDPDAVDDQLLQLEVFLHQRSLEVLVPFTMRHDGSLVTSAAVLEGIGIKVPAAQKASQVEVPLAELPGVTYRYDEAAQAIHFTLEPSAQYSARIGGGAIVPVPEAVRPPFGALVNYTLFASADGGGDGLRFEGLSGAFETRVFGRFGLIENSLVGRTGGGGGILRLDSTYSYEDPARLTTYIAGDTISGGFAWTRPIRLGGLQIRRSFGLRPDLITVAVPTLGGTAAAPSTLDLYVNKVRTLSADVPQGPYEIAHPPIIYGSGQARLVLRDALGRETVSTTSFYASPELLAVGLTDFSAELGFARRNYATLSNDYDKRLAFSVSARRGITHRLTVLAHGEGAGGGFASLGGGAVFTLGTVALGSVAVSGSRTPAHLGGLIDLSLESRLPRLSILLRTQRTFGDYQDLASWTIATTPDLPSERRIYGQPREVDQASVSMPLWKGSAAGVSYVRIRRADDARARLLNLSFTQDLGRLAVFASAARDFEVRGSTAIFAGLSIPLGGGVTASGGATRTGGRTSSYVEASRQGAQAPGAFGWEVRASDGERREAHGILRYSGNFARFEAAGLYAGDGYSATGLMEGAVSLVGGEVHATHRLDDAFALVEVGAPGVTVLRENRAAGVTGKHGKLLVTGLAPFVANRIAIDPAALPVDARVEETETVTTPFNRVPSLVNFAVEAGRGAALAVLVDPQGKPIELGSTVRLQERDQEFVVGYDGETYLDDLDAHNVLIATTPEGEICRAEAPFKARAGEQVRIGPLVCLPEVIP